MFTVFHIPPILYHGSSYKHFELQSGYLRSKELRKWDNTESNEFLYATSDKTVALTMGIASLSEQLVPVKKFRSTETSISITLEDPNDREKLLSCFDHAVIYVYTIETNPAHHWQKVGNVVNNLDDEYKTNEIIRAKFIKATYSVSLFEYLRTINFTINTPS